MASLSNSKRQQITDELAKQGITGTEEAINAVVEILKGDQRATISSAARRYAATAEAQNQSNSEESEDESDLSNKARILKNSLKKSLKRKIVTDAFSEVIADFKNGDFGDLKDDELTIDIDFEEVLSGENFSLLSPALPPNSEKLLLLDSKEVLAQ